MLPILSLNFIQNCCYKFLFIKRNNVYCKITSLHCFQSADGEGAVGGGGSSAESSVSSGDVDDSFEGKDSDKEGKKKKNRCAVCRKKVGLTGACHISLPSVPNAIDLPVLNGDAYDSFFSYFGVHGSPYS